MRTVALTPSEINTIAERITVRISGANKGSGVIINNSNNIYTVLSNAHVIKNKGQYEVHTYDGRNYPISNIREAPDNIDLALFEFSSNTEYPIAQMADSDTVRRGNQIFVSGYPQGKVDMNFLDSLVVRIDGNLQKGYALVYRIGAYPGMSGGPILNDQGKLIGIHGESQPINIPGDFGGIITVTREEQGIPIKIYQRLPSYIKINPNSADAYNNRGLARSDLGDKQGAIADYNQAITLDPKNALAYNNRGVVRSDLGDKQGAIADYNQAITLDPNYALAYNNRGFVYYDLNNKQNAIDDWQTSIRINNKNSDALLGLAVALYNQGKQEEAYSLAQQALKLDKNFADVKFLKEKHFLERSNNQ